MIVGGIWPLVDAATMRALDRRTIEDLGIPAEILMESAGRAVAQAVLEMSADRPGEAVSVICGSGNNGGDGLVVARQLHLLGIDVVAWLAADPARLVGDAAANCERARRVGVRLGDASAGGEDLDLPTRGVIVDALFGTGLSRDVEGPLGTLIDRINSARDASGGALRVLAIDLPSGLDADTGQVLGRAIRADATVTVALPKLGLVLEPGRSHAGHVTVARIGIADDAPDAELRTVLWSPAAAASFLPDRPRSGHKGTFGHVLLVAGGEGRTGAAALAAAGAGRAGAGLVTLACPAALNDILEVKCTEAMTAPVADTPARAFAAAAEDAVLALAADRDVLAMGPGVGRSHETVSLMRAIAKRLDQPLVIDADGLFAFAEEPAALRARDAATILTPHPGEAARLLGCTAAEVNGDRVAAARSLADRTGAVVLLKGAPTIAASPAGDVIVNPTGGPALATGGTGDVLAGIVAAFLAQHLRPLEAAALAAYVHGGAGDRLAIASGSAGLLASDLAAELPATLAALRAQARSGAPVEAGVGLAVSLPGC